MKINMTYENEKQKRMKDEHEKWTKIKWNIKNEKWNMKWINESCWGIK